MRDIRQLNYIIGSLGSGKTRLAKRIAETLPNASFIGVDRVVDRCTATARPKVDAQIGTRLEGALARLVQDGATMSNSLVALFAAIEIEGPGILIVDMIEQGLDQVTQEAVIAHLRRRGVGARPLFVLTRSLAILDLSAVGPAESIILCPANHSPPSYVVPVPGAAGYEAVATCLASPEVRARTEGVIAWRPDKPAAAMPRSASEH